MSNIQVAVRARPLSKREQEMNSAVSVEMRNKATIIFKTVSGVTVGESKEDNKEFEYDYSYWSVNPADMHFITQEQVYNDLGKSVLESAFQGYNACVFAYGQTGSGKTHTMMGTEESPGLIPRICENLYAHIVNGSKKNVSYRVEASYMEIYNEKVGDLLQSASPEKIHKLKVREHPREGPYVENLSRHNVANFQEISDLMKAGNRRRVTASTKMNDVSSRSHAIFTILFTQAAYSSDIPCETVSKIHLVDLAGSERASATGAEGLRLKEGGNINKSLACLGNVISALADMSSGGGRGKKTFIPYRDSVLTWLLKDSLGGNSKTIMVATISPAVANYGETLSTLRYASRAKNIVNKPVVNEDANVKLIRELRTEIQRLKSIITAAKLDPDCDLKGTESAMEYIHKNEEMIAELTKSWAGKWDQGLQELVEESNLALHSDGIKMTLGSERPHLLAVDNDAFGGGIVIYHLKDGMTSVGALGASPTPDIALSGEDIKPKHCAVHSTSGKVRLILEDGQCFVNRSEVLEDHSLAHGDLLQLGEEVVFRFNHPEEAQRNKQIGNTPRSALLPLSPISPSTVDDSHDRSEDFEEQKEALEKDYTQKMDRLREELEKEKEEDRARFLQEIEALRQQAMYTPTNESSDLDGPRKSITYDLLQSVAFSPIVEVTSRDISDRVVEGKEQEERAHTPSHSWSSDRMRLSTPNSDSQEDQRMLDISIVEKDGFCLVSKIGDEADGQESADSGNEAGSTCDLQLKATRDELSDTKKLAEKEKSELELQLSEAKKRTISLQRHMYEKELEYESEQKKLKRQYESLEQSYIRKDLPRDMRGRSNDMDGQTTPRSRRLRQRSQSASRSLRRTNTNLKVEVPGCLLRGQGWSSYYVYEVRVYVQGKKWTLYKSYPQFKVFYEDIVKRYSQLSILTFPSSKWFGAKNREFVERRRLDLQAFMQSLLAICVTLPQCPIYNSRHLTKDKLYTFSSFFDCGERTGL